ncbi:MAG: NifU family protein [Ignavibacteria bacterium]|nr:NifU family protein [Ignavibacteria bacterium]
MVTPEGIEESLQRIRPFLHVDGGDVAFVRITEDRIVEVRLVGSCECCPMSTMTLRAGIERAILADHADVRRVEQVR